jgi:hypothetical protein
MEEAAVRTIPFAALGVWLSLSGRALSQEAVGAADAAPEPNRLAFQPPPPVPFNQQLATVIAERLRENANLRQYRIDVTFAEGVADLSGMVTGIAQRDEVVRTVQGVSGVERVRDNLKILHPPSGLMAAQARGPGDVVPPPLTSPGGALPPEPLPIFQAPAGQPNPSLQPPPLPPYAWPTFAPYNNYSRVAYPQSYPYEAWPFIGPNYPFPKVPLGWRAVTLRWEDGHWFYGRTPTGHDWWRIRYW